MAKLFNLMYIHLSNANDLPSRYCTFFEDALVLFYSD
jgi:hypothetical protein